MSPRRRGAPKLVAAGTVVEVTRHLVDNKAVGREPRATTRITLDVDAWGIGELDKAAGPLADPTFELAKKILLPVIGDRVRITCTTATGRHADRLEIDPVGPRRRA